MKRKWTILFTVLCSVSVWAQVKPNEKLQYSASYRMGGLMTQIAQVTMETDLTKTARKSYLHLSLLATTFSKWDSFFKIRDLYESYVDPTTFKTALYLRNITEGKYHKTEKYAIASGKTVVNATTKRGNGPEEKNTFTIGAATSDVVALIYRLRTVDFAHQKPGQLNSFMIVFDQKEYPVTLKFVGTETINTGFLGKKECFKLAVSAKTNKLKGKDKNLIWLTADAHKLPVLVQFSIPVGTGQLQLTSASGF